MTIRQLLWLMSHGRHCVFRLHLRHGRSRTRRVGWRVRTRVRMHGWSVLHGYLLLVLGHIRVLFHLSHDCSFAFSAVNCLRPPTFYSLAAMLRMRASARVHVRIDDPPEKSSTQSACSNSLCPPNRLLSLSGGYKEEEEEEEAHYGQIRGQIVMESQFFACVPTKLLETPKERVFFWSDTSVSISHVSLSRVLSSPRSSRESWFTTR